MISWQFAVSLNILVIVFSYQFELWFQWSMTWCDHLIDVISRTTRGYSLNDMTTKAVCSPCWSKTVNFFFGPVWFGFYMQSAVCLSFNFNISFNYRFTCINTCVISQANRLCNRMVFFSSSPSLKLSIARSSCVNIEFIQFEFRWLFTSTLWQAAYVAVPHRAQFNG